MYVLCYAYLCVDVWLRHTYYILIYCIAMCSRQELASSLARAGQRYGELDRRNAGGLTPLMVAASVANATMVELLLDARAGSCQVNVRSDCDRHVVAPSISHCDDRKHVFHIQCVNI
jgi:ankyrin repeat protein